MPAAFIVDGHLEKKVIQRLCADAPVRLTNLNGRDVSISAIVDKLETLIRLFRGRYYPVVIVVDREQRVESSITIEDEVAGMLRIRGVDPKDLIVSCPDRMIENWIVAGTTSFQGKSESVLQDKSESDGCHGKNVLKKFLSDRKVPYGETTTGVDMFCRIDFDEAARHSESYGRFHRRLAPFCPKLRG